MSPKKISNFVVRSVVILMIASIILRQRTTDIASCEKPTEVNCFLPDLIRNADPILHKTILVLRPISARKDKLTIGVLVGVAFAKLLMVFIDFKIGQLVVLVLGT